MIIVTRDTTADRYIRHRLYDTDTGIRYNFEVAEDDTFAPQYDATNQPIRLIVEHPATPVGEDLRPLITYGGIEAIDFLQQCIHLDITLEGVILMIIHEAMVLQKAYYDRLPESKKAMEKLQEERSRRGLTLPEIPTIGMEG